MTKPTESETRNKLLLVAYHFPPIQGSTGVNRTVAFSRYLVELGWDVTVLTICEDAYEDTSTENLKLIPRDVRVERAWGVDARRRFSILGRYPMLLALPDRWQSWILGAYFRGKKLARGWSPDVVMSTYPVPSAHCVAYLLSRKFDIPWVAEFRDPMLQSSYPAHASERRVYAKIENVVFDNATDVVVTTPGCQRMYRERFPSYASERIHVISNGYDPTLFADTTPLGPSPTPNSLVLLHSGLLYPHERNPQAFFRAIRSLVENGAFNDVDIEFRFRASGNDTHYRERTRELEIDSYVKFLPRLPYVEALAEMKGADALVIFQADNCNDQIPAKVYEYLYCGRPILAFADPIGDTGKLLSEVGIQSIAKLEDPARIEVVTDRFLKQIRNADAYVVPDSEVLRFSRQSLTCELSQVLASSLVPT